MAVRGVFAVVMAFGFLVASKEFGALHLVRSRLVMVRAALEATVSFLFITSLAVLPLADITAIVQSTPIILTFLAVVLGIERVGWRRWSAIICGFAGVLLIVKPKASGLDTYALIAFATAALIAWRDLVTRSIGAHVPSIVITVSTTFAVAVTGFVVGLGEIWRPLDLYAIGLLFAAAVLVTLGNFTVVMAFRGTDVSVVSPFRYSNVPLAILLGFFVFGELPDAMSFAGIALIIASGLYTIHRERERRRGATGLRSLETQRIPE